MAPRRPIDGTPGSDNCLNVIQASGRRQKAKHEEGVAIQRNNWLVAVSRNQQSAQRVPPRMRRRQMSRSLGKFGCSLLAITAAGLASSAYAQEVGGSGDNVETVTVTGSLITIQGYQAPTPVTVISEQQLNRDAHINIVDSITNLPSVGQSETLSNGNKSGDLSQGDAALSLVNLRNLGVARTLVLFDGQRVVSSNLFGGGVDLTTIPTDLVKRVDVVTGGASAAYGSDAVSGVVNLILDKTFTGLKGELEGSNGYPLQHRQVKAALTWGTEFAAGRGHFILSGDHTWSNDPVFNGQPSWYNNGAIVQNPAATSSNGLPYYIHVRNTGQAQYTQGGLIRGNTAGGAGSTLAPDALIGTQFVGNGEAAPFNFGTVDASHPNVCYAGCSNNARNYPYVQNLIAIPYHSSTLFSYASYQVTPDIKASLQVNYGLMSEQSNGGTRTSTVKIAADNPFLPQSISGQFGVLSNGYDTATGMGGTAIRPDQTITIGTINTNNLDLDHPFNLNESCRTVGVPCLRINRQLFRAVFTLEGVLGDNWSWNTYLQHSQVRQRQVAAQDSFGPHYNYAIDAVRVTPTNVGTSGLPIGSIQCRALLDPATSADAAGCAPLNIFGNGVASDAAILYVNPGRNPDSGILNQELIILNQDVLHGSMQGQLPWGLPAGEIAIAFGAEYRHEQAAIPYADPHGAVGAYAAGNFRAYSGEYNIKEGFVEINAPVLHDDVVQSLDFSAAARMTDYSTSGMVETWKLGLTSQIDDNIKLRGTWSLDIRSPLISDLFAPGIFAVAQLQYPPGSPSYQTLNAQGGNPNLDPEKAVTVSGGVVLTPAFIDNLSISLDWYNIDIHGGIYSSDAQTVINRCFQGEQLYCSLLKFANGAPQPTEVDTFPVNAADIRTSGLDFQANYSTGFLDGMLSWYLVGNYVDELTQTAVGVTYDSAGALGGPLAYAASGMPKLRGTLAATYTEGPWSATVQGRFLGSAVLTNGVENLPASIRRASLSPTGVLTSGVGNGDLIDNNAVDPVGYLDLRLSYQWKKGVELYGAMDNVTNVPRPEDGSNTTYDPLGRVIRAGVRFSY
jgi:outer membrane receptor protein involved in Fe transport